MKIGDRIPEFELADQDNNRLSSSNLLGNGLTVLFFYPRDHTIVCTMEACGFRDSYEKFVEEGVRVIGISSDSPERHKSFIVKHNLPFTLLSDLDNSVRRQFNVQPGYFGMVPGRITFIISSEGKILYQIKSQLIAGKHIRKALKFVKNYQQSKA